MTTSIDQILERLPIGGKLNLLCNMLDDLIQGKDETLAALRQEAEALGLRPVIVGGVAVIKHGYERTTKDRDVLLDYQRVDDLAFRLMDHPDWDRLEIRQYAFLYKPTGIPVDFLVSGDLMHMGRPYLFPRTDKVELKGELEGLPIIGLNDLLWLKLMAGRMQDKADMMQLCKLHLAEVDASRVLAVVQDEDDDLRQTFHEFLRQAVTELDEERRLGQGIGGMLARQKPTDPPPNTQ